MSDYLDTRDKIRAHLEELERKHRTLDELILSRYHNVTVDEEVRKLKTMKLYLKDEIHRLNAQLIQLELK